MVWGAGVWTRDAHGINYQEQFKQMGRVWSFSYQLELHLEDTSNRTVAKIIKK
jgi:hypothetical protein